MMSEWKQLPKAAVLRSPSYDVIINEWSQGESGSKEWNELAVTALVNMQGWDFGDNSAGDLTFSNHPLWETVLPGTRILIYNGNDRDPTLPPDDTDPSDCRLVIAHNDPTYFSGSWPLFANSTASDNPHLRDANDATVHDFSVDPGTALHPGSNESVHYNGNTAAGVGNSDNWSTSAASSATPGAGNGELNTSWLDDLCSSGSGSNGQPDLALEKRGPTTAVAGENISYEIRLRNSGTLSATGVILTDTLPAGLTYVNDDSGYPHSQPTPETAVWQIGTVPTDTLITFNLTATIEATTLGAVANQITATTVTTETMTANNSALFTTTVNSATPPAVLIDAVLYNGYENGDADEAILLRNTGSAVNIGSWKLGDGTDTAVLPPGTVFSTSHTIWLANDGTAFRRQFGFAADFEAVDSDATIPNLGGEWPGFANSGDEVVLWDAGDKVVDALVYKDGDTAQTGWRGAATLPGDQRFCGRGANFVSSP